MALYKRGRIYWTYIYVDGIRHAKSTSTSNRRIAEKVDQDFKEELMRVAVAMDEAWPGRVCSERLCHRLKLRLQAVP